MVLLKQAKLAIYSPQILCHSYISDPYPISTKYQIALIMMYKKISNSSQKKIFFQYLYAFLKNNNNTLLFLLFLVNFEPKMVK